MWETMLPIGAKFRTIVELCPRRIFPFGGDMFRGVHMGVKCFFSTICHRRSVVGLCHKQDSLMRCTATFVARDRRRSCAIRHSGPFKC